MSDRLKLKSLMEVPGNDWRCRMPEDDWLIIEQTYPNLREAVKAYRRSKNYPIGSGFEADLQNWMCADLPDRYCLPVDAENANAGQKLARFAREFARWAAAGFPVVTADVQAQRMAACQKCRYYLPQGNAGMGQCVAPGCGCTRLKLWLTTTKCPHPEGSRWTQ